MADRETCFSEPKGILANSLCVTTALFLTTSTGLAAGDGAAGQQFFATHCAACHATQPGTNTVGPSLAGVVGRKSGTVSGYNYSPALKAANITWDQTSLDKWLQNPVGDVHGARMFIMVPNASDRQNVIAYLDTLK
jgi:cytochrome c